MSMGKEQAQAAPRLAAEPRRYKDRSLSDFAIAFLVVLGGGLLFVSADVVELLTPTLLRWEAAELDDLLLTACLAIVATTWFAIRRWLDSATQLAELRRSAQERAAYLERLEELSTQLLDAEARERDRIADVLHDEVGQTLYACQLKLEVLAAALDDPDALALLDQATALTAAAMTHARDLSMELSPPALHDLGIADAIETLLSRLEQRYALPMRFAPNAAWEHIPREFVGPVFHSVKELVVNAAKHASASTVSLSAELADGHRVRVIVRDDGTGFEVRPSKPRGFGLFSIERRMACMHGRLEIDSIPGKGTTAILHLGQPDSP
jgi:signal transduction histidine kinase